MLTVDYESLWAAIPYPAFVVGEKNIIVNANNAAEAFCMYSIKQIVNKPIVKYVGDNSVILNALQSVRVKLVSLALYDVEIFWGGLKPELFDVYAAPISILKGDILLLFHSQAISKKMDRSLSHRSAVRSVTGMASMLAHEIRNPLAGISGAAQLLMANASDSDKELIDIICFESNRINKLVGRFQNFGDLRPIKKNPVNVHNVLETAKRAAMAGYASHVKIIEQYDPSLPLVPGDADLLLQVIQNLLKNAAEAVPKQGGVIILSTSFRQGVRISLGGDLTENLPLQITIADNGCGVSDQLVKDIFEPFVSSKTNGTGLGLSLVSKIISDHGGVVEHSNINGKTSFTLLLPVYSDKMNNQE
jgi:two-component system nitrogen regulation sensor histidine kinase GlnL